MTFDASRNYRPLIAARRWIQEHTAPDSIVLANANPALYLYTGRHAFGLMLDAAAGPLYGIETTSLKDKVTDIENIAQRYPAPFVIWGPADIPARDYGPVLDSLSRTGLLSPLAAFGDERIYQFRTTK